MMTTERKMQPVIDRVYALFKKAGAESRLEPPASEEQIARWESENGRILPPEIKEFLLFSNGFKIGWSFKIFPLDRIRVIKDWVGVPEGWLYLGDLIGDGCYIVCDTEGKLISCDSECRPLLSDLDLAEWIEDHVIDMICEELDVDPDED